VDGVAGNGHIGRGAQGGIVFKHRSTDAREIFFLANTTPHATRFRASFRISGRQPNRWDAVTGEVRALPAFEQRDGRTEIPLYLEAGESLFVVFDTPIEATARGSADANHTPLRPVLALAGPWKVAFDGPGAPATTRLPHLIDWSTHEDPAVRAFSGRATYRKEFTWSKQDAAHGPTWLHLGEVAVLAEVTVNGRDLGPLWTAPWRVDVGPHLRPGTNSVQIRVTNTWHNRLTSDAGKPAGQRVSHVSQRYRKLPGDALQSAGLIGPVTLQQPRGDR
jgi:hypothetical protein